MNNTAEVLDVPLKGLYQNIPFEQYLKYDAISSSGLVKLAQSPLHYQAYLKQTHKETPAKRLGKLIHSAILEPESFKQFAFMPEKINRTTKEGKSKYDDFMAENHNNTIVTRDEYETIAGVLESCYRHPTVAPLLKVGINEVSGFWTDYLTGVNCKIRIDKLLPDNKILDIKTTENASKHAFMGSIAKYKYQIQTSWYLEGLGMVKDKLLDQFLHIVIEKEPPYGIQIFAMDAVSIAAGSDEIRKLMDVYSDCLKNNNWPGYPTGVQTISLPNYMLNVSE